MEVVQQQDQQQQDGVSDADLAVFEAGFNSARGDEESPRAENETPPKDEPKDVETEEVTAETSDKPVEDGDEPFLDGMTKSQVKALLAKAGEVDTLKAQLDQERQRIFGKFGEVQRYINDLKATRQEGGAVSGAKLNKLREQFPELADMIEADLSVGGQPQGQPIDRAEFEKLVDERASAKVAALERKVEEQRITAVCGKKWKEEINTPDFALWMQTLPAEKKHELVNSNDADVVVDGIMQFKAWHDKGQQQKQRNRNRLENAITPSGHPAASPSGLSDEEIFAKSFARIRGG